jgi:dTDP-4-amino-4,6-dideoxygalactose transaminase
MSDVVVPQVDPRSGYLAQKDEIDAAIAKVLDGGWYVLGREVTAFETEFAAYLRAPHAVGVASGTDAIEIALRAIGVGPGDTVITVSHTAVATVAAIERCGAQPVFVDIDPDTFTMDAPCLEVAFQSIQSCQVRMPKAVVPVHLYGQAADMTSIVEIARRFGAYVIEDCAQAHGAAQRGHRVGTLGDLAAFSFYPTKNLGAFGDGGIVVTASEDLAERLRCLREYGWRDRYISEKPGINSRLDELQAAILRVRLRKLDDDNGARRRLADLYRSALVHAEVIHPTVGRDNDHVYHQYVIRCPRRDALRANLSQRGITTGIHYPVPVHLQPAFRGRVAYQGPLEHTERAASEILSLPMFPHLSESDIRSVSAHCLDILRKPA